MIPFERYSAIEDPSSARILELLDRLDINQNLTASKTFEELRVLVRETPAHSKAAAIYARLYFWGCVDYEVAREDLSYSISESYLASLGLRYREGIISDLGRRLIHELTGMEFSAIDRYLAYCDVATEDINLLPQSNESWYYIPEKAGFFGVLDETIKAMFICHYYGKGFQLDTGSGWWPYPVPFREIFGSLIEAETRAVVGILPPATVRQLISTGDRKLVEAYVRFKKKKYARVKDLLMSKYAYLGGPTGYFDSLSESAAYYVRGGDKLLYEAILPPTNHVLDDLELLFRRSENLYILSDDYQLAESYLDRLGSSKVRNLTRRDFSGYDMRNVASVDDVEAILRNYLTLASVKYSMSCPTCNLANSAHWSNPRLVDDVPLRSISALKNIG